MFQFCPLSQCPSEHSSPHLPEQGLHWMALFLRLFLSGTFPEPCFGDTDILEEMSPPPVFNKPFLGGGVWCFLVIRFRFRVVSWNATGCGACCSEFHTWRLGGPPGSHCCSGSWVGSVWFLCCIIIILCVSLATSKQSAKRPLKTGWIFCPRGNLPRRGSHRGSGLVPPAGRLSSQLSVHSHSGALLSLVYMSIY